MHKYPGILTNTPIGKAEYRGTGMSEEQIPQMDSESMYLEEVFTDQNVGQIRQMTPVTTTGEKDTSRDTFYTGHTQMMTPQGPLPLDFEIAATDLAGAIAMFSEEARKAMVETIQRIEEMQREKASSIVVPGQTASGIHIP